MKKVTLSTLLLLFTMITYGQINLNETFDDGNPADWTGTFFTSATQACSGESTRDNLYSFSNTGNLTSPNIIGQSNETDLTVMFDYKIVDWSAATSATPAGWGSFVLQYSLDAGANWVDIATIDDDNHVVSADCASMSYTVAGADIPDGSDFQFRFDIVWASGDYYMYYDNVAIFQVAEDPPLCDAALLTPTDAQVDAEISGFLQWSTASGIPTGYFVSVGTTMGGTDIADNIDVGNVTSYTVGLLEYETTYYVTITPYNALGSATGCTEYSFTTKADPSITVDCAVGPEFMTYCYTNDDETEWLYTSSDGSPLRITFIDGLMQSCCDFINIYDGVDNTGTVLFSGNNDGDLAGITFDSVGTSIFIDFDTTGFTSCADGSNFTSEMNFSVSCATCTNPTVDFSVVQDCENGPQFFAEANITDLGSATSLTVTDNQGSTAQTVSAAGIVQFGPFPNLTDVVLSVSNDDDVNCVANSVNLTQEECVLNIIDCTQSAQNFTYCYDNNDTKAWLFVSSDGSPIRINFNSGGMESCCDEILIYDGADNTGALLYQGNNGGNLSGLTFDATGDSLYVELDTDGSVSCASNSFCCTQDIDFDVVCATCVNPAATYTVVSDCGNGPQFFVDVEITDLGSATSLTVTDDQGSASQTSSALGVLTFGPYTNLTDVSFTVANDDDVNCVISSQSVTQPFCTEYTVDCAAGPVDSFYCYENNDTNVFTYTSNDGTPLNLTINSGTVEGDPWDFLVILDSDGVTELYNGEGNNGNLAGLTFQSTGDTIYFSVTSDGSASCDSGSFCCSDGIDYTVSCATCINPQVAFEIVDDCDNGDQFLLEVDVTSLGDATSLEITDNQGSAPIIVTETGTVLAGPFGFGFQVIMSVENQQDPNCFLISQGYSVNTCPPDNDNCPDAIVAAVNADESCDLLTAGTIFGATPSSQEGSDCFGIENDDVWFEFTALEEFQIIQILNITGGTNNLDHTVYSGTCDNLTELYCSDQTASLAENLTVGETYFIRIFSGGTFELASNTFDLCIRPGGGNVLVDQETYTIEELVEDVLINAACAQISNITSSTGTDFGSTNGIGYFFLNGPDGFPFDEGIIMTSGDAEEAEGPNTNAMSAGGFTWPGDADLAAEVGIVSNNASIIEFDFVPLTDEISFDFIMASEEYNGSTGGSFECTYSDAFAFFLTDEDGVTTNLAVLPGTTTPILVTNIHPTNPSCPAINEEYFGGYTGANLPPISFDGRTTVFTAESPVNLGETYHIKLVISDASDSALDSGVYLQAGSFDIGEVDLGEDITLVSGNASCSGEPVVISTLATEVDHVWYKDGFVVDGESSSELVTTESGEYTVQIIFSPDCIISDSIIVEFFDNPIANQPGNLFGCIENSTGFTEVILEDQDAEILGTQSPAEFTVTYHLTEQDAIDNVDALVSPYMTVTNPQVIYARVTDNTQGCYAYTSFEVLVENIPTINDVADMVTCDDASGDEIEDFDLDSQTAGILGGIDPATVILTYHASMEDADDNINALTSPYTNTSNPQTIYVRVQDVNSTSCFASTTFDLIISGPTPEATSLDYGLCDDAANDGVEEFDLSSHDEFVLNGQDDTIFTVSYYGSEADANAGANALASAYTNTSNPQTVWARVESNVAFDCYSVVDFDLIVESVPVSSFDPDFAYEVCPNATVPIEIMATADNYSESDVTIAWYQDGGLIDGETSLSLPVLVQGTYTIEVMFNGTGCVSTAEVFVVELDACVIPQGISPNGDGLNDNFDLSGYDVHRLEIYNRNGTLVYSKDTYLNEWFGQTNDGDELPVGTYFYVMRYQDNKERSAWVYINK